MRGRDRDPVAGRDFLQCRAVACGAAIMFVRREDSGRLHPFEPAAAPGPAGEWVLDHDLLGERIARRVGPGEGTHRSHFVTCVAASDFRDGGASADGGPT